MYKTTVGLEVHVELKTKSKFFSNTLNSYTSLPNHNVNFVDLAYPGTLPTINKKAIDLGIKAALLFNCDISKKMHFDRKNYFYPDNPKNYQITQSRTPIGKNGYIEIELNNKKKKIRIHDIHLEEDTAKSVHKDKSSYLDFNRSGLGLIEIVTEADLESGEEAVLYLEKLRELLIYSDVSDCKIEEGSMRCDANISISKTKKLGTKVEIKNIGSINNVKLAIEKEAKRQEEILENGGVIKEETRRYDDKLGDTVLMRVKESASDYRYFPDTNIPPFELSDEYIEKVKNTLPISAEERRKIYKEKGLIHINIEKILRNREISDYLNLFIDEDIDFLNLSNLLLGPINEYLNKESISIFNTLLDKERMLIILRALDDKKINNKTFKDILKDLMESDKDTKDILKKAKEDVIDSEDELKEIIHKIFKNNQKEVDEYNNGNDRLLKFFVGQVMKETKGKANPQMTNKIIKKEISKF